MPRTPESRMAMVTLQIACDRFPEAVTLSEMRDEIFSRVRLTSEDLEWSRCRPKEKNWVQTVRNVAGQGHYPGSPIFRGFMTYSREGFRATKEGKDFLSGPPLLRLMHPHNEEAV